MSELAINRASQRRDNLARLLAHTLGPWTPVGVMEWLSWKVADAINPTPKRRFRTCAMPRCGKCYYGVKELCRECRQTVKDRPR